VSRLSVLLVEDHAMVRKGLRTILELEGDIDVVAEADNGREAVALAEEFRPDVVVMDISMPGLNGLEATSQIKDRISDVNILVLTRHSTEAYVSRIFKAGASGYVTKREAPTELIAGIRAVGRGDAFLSPSISKTVIDDYVRRADRCVEDSLERLTPREREVLQLVAEGRSSPEIGDLLYISAKTVENHRANLMKKLDIHSTAELTQYAIRKGVISVDP